MISLRRKKRQIFRYDFFMNILWLNLWFSYGEFYDFCTTLARGESGSRNHKKIQEIRHKIIIFFHKIFIFLWLSYENFIIFLWISHFMIFYDFFMKILWFFLWFFYQSPIFWFFLWISHFMIFMIFLWKFYDFLWFFLGISHFFNESPSLWFFLWKAYVF